MSIESDLQARSGSTCELCGATNDLAVYEVSGGPGDEADSSLLGCQTCRDQIDDPDQTDPNHWRCLNDSMWSQVPAVQVIAWQMLHRLKGEGWPNDLIDMMYMEDATKEWAELRLEAGGPIKHVDSNGNVLQAGDSVVLIKSLDVKGSSLTAKRGTAVRNIRLVADNAEHIEGRVDGQQIVILTKFVKKSN